jgi:hypothetical protein
MKKTLIALGLVLAMAAFSTTALAASSTLFGGAVNQNDSVTLVSNTSDSDPNNDFSGIDFDVAPGTTFGSLTALSTDFNVTDDDCIGGSPRFQVNIDGKNLFIYLGPTPSFSGCAMNTWTSSGNLIGSTDLRFDLTQYGGPFYGTYADTLALLGSEEVTGIQLVIDSGWAFSDGEQTVLIDNVNINGMVSAFTSPPASKDECKNGGWMDFGGMFKNQGQCVAFVASGGKSLH